MSSYVYADGILVESWDDESRTYTDYTTTPPTSRPYNEQENAEADSNVEADARMDDFEARLLALEAAVFPPQPDPQDPDDPSIDEWGDLVPAGWWYHDTLLRDTDGTIYRNISGTVLTNPPSDMPAGGSAWLGNLFVVVTPGNVDPSPGTPEGYVGPWSATATYGVDNVVDDQGHYWRCRIPHGPERQGTWRPGPSIPTVWEDLGPV